MNLLKRPVAASMIVTSLSLLGAISILRLPVALLPNLASPGVTVLIRYPGVSSDAIERILTIPVERRLRDLPDLDTILSSSGDGESRVHLVFTPGTDVHMRMLDVREKLFEIEDRFPREVEPPSVFRYDPSDRPVYIVSFSHDEKNSSSLQQLFEIVEFQIKPRFERIHGISEIFTGGGAEREIHLQVDPHRLAALNLADDVPTSLHQANLFMGSGRIEKNRTSVYTDARLRSIQDIGKLSVPAHRSYSADTGRSSIPFRAFATVEESRRDPTSVSLNNGREQVSLYIQKAGDANTLSVTEECEQVRRIVADRFPELQIHAVYNQGSRIKEAISQLVVACIGGIILAVSILHVFVKRIGFTAAIGIVIPASLLTTFFLMFLFHIGLNVMSLSGLALGAGMVIDSSIVVCEASARALSTQAEETGSHLSAISRAVASVRAEIIASTLSTIIVFIPLLFADYETRKLYIDFTLTVSLSLLVSMFFSLLLLPVFLIHAAKGESLPLFRGNLLTNVAPFLVPGIKRTLDVPFFTVPYWISLYTRFAERKGWAFPALGSLACIVLFFISEKEYIQQTRSDTIEATIDLAPGIHLDKTREIVQRIENRIATHPSARYINARIENSHATLTIRMPHSGNSEETITDLQQMTDGLPDAYVHYERSNAQTNAAELELQLYGEDITAMKDFARTFSKAVQKEIPEIERVIFRFREGRQDLVLYPHRAKLQLSGMNTSDIGRTLRLLIHGNIITKFYDTTPGREREVDVRIRAGKEQIQNPDDLMQLQMPGTTVPLKSLVRPVYEESETRIYRENQRRTISLLFRFQNASVETVASRVQSLLDGAVLPPETVAEFGHAYQHMLRNQQQMVATLLLALILIYLLLAFLFEDLIDPFIVLAVIPVSLSCVFLLLILLDRPLNINIYIGLIMLGGIVVNNAILVLAEIRKQNPSNLHDFYEVGFRRLRPITMTTLTTVLGMAPLLFDTGSQSALWNSLAITVTSGLIFSMPLALFIIPLLAFMQKEAADKQTNAPTRRESVCPE